MTILLFLLGLANLCLAFATMNLLPLLIGASCVGVALGSLMERG